MAAGQRDEVRIDEAAVTHVEHVAQPAAFGLAREQPQEGGEGVAVDAGAGVEAPA